MSSISIKLCLSVPIPYTCSQIENSANYTMQGGRANQWLERRAKDKIAPDIIFPVDKNSQGGHRNFIHWSLSADLITNKPQNTIFVRGSFSQLYSAQKVLVATWVSDSLSVVPLWTPELLCRMGATFHLTQKKRIESSSLSLIRPILHDSKVTGLHDGP